MNAKGFGSPDVCINYLGYVAFSEKNVRHDRSGFLVTVSAASVMWLSVRNTWDMMNIEGVGALVTASTASVMWLSMRNTWDMTNIEGVGALVSVSTA